MIKKLKIKTLSIIILGFSMAFTGCQKSAENNLFNADKDYYEGLKAMESGKTAYAFKCFQNCFENGSYFCALRSGEALTKMGSIPERESASEKLVEKFDSDDSRLIAAKLFTGHKEYATVLKYTKDIDLATGNNTLIALKFNAMYETGSRNLVNEVEKWFLTRKISSEHYKFYLRFIKNKDIIEKSGQIFSTNHQPLEFSEEFLNLVEFRIAVYSDKYGLAFSKIPDIAERYMENEEILSHIGKACLYGSKDYLKNARFFERLAERFENFHCKYYAYFYAGRMYSKQGSMHQAAVNRFRSSLDYAVSGAEYDNSLWYLLDSSLKNSTDKALLEINKYCKLWSDSEYFEDFFDLVSTRLISEQKWSLFGTLYKSLDSYASDATVAKFAYLYGRFLQAGFAKISGKNQVQEEMESAFLRSLNSGSEPYYRVMALYQLGSNESTVSEVLRNIKINKNFKKNPEAESFLLGYADFGLGEKIYPEYLALREKGIEISLETGVQLANYLNVLGEKENKFYPQSLRLASKIIANCEKIPEEEQIKIIYPRDYMDLISENCKKYGLDEEHIFALIRTESFFDKDISSSKGACGLTQLMRPTAGDVAKKLKWKEFDINDSAQNIEMGVYYLSELIGRLEKVVLPAFFAYNAGITKVRRWMENSRIELGGKIKLPLDLFLETIPYQETRGYGRKLVTASSYYGWLYYNKSVTEIVQAIMGKF